MWECPGCGEALEEQFDSCWRCGTGNPDQDSLIDGEPETGDNNADLSPDEMLQKMLHLQMQQQGRIRAIQRHVGCLYSYMVFSLVVSAIVALMMFSN